MKNYLLQDKDLQFIQGGCAELGRFNAGEQAPAVDYGVPINNLANHGQLGDRQKARRAANC